MVKPVETEIDLQNDYSDITGQNDYREIVTKNDYSGEKLEELSLKQQSKSFVEKSKTRRSKHERKKKSNASVCSSVKGTENFGPG
jgi:hypothetical protein